MESLYNLNLDTFNQQFPSYCLKLEHQQQSKFQLLINFNTIKSSLSILSFNFYYKYFFIVLLRSLAREYCSDLRVQRTRCTTYAFHWPYGVVLFPYTSHVRHLRVHHSILIIVEESRMETFLFLWIFFIHWTSFNNNQPPKYRWLLQVNLVWSAGFVQITEYFYEGFQEIWPFQKGLNACINLKMKLIIKIRTAFQSNLCKYRPFPKYLTVLLKYGVSAISEQTVAGSFSAIEGAYKTNHTSDLRIALLDGIIFQGL